MGKACRINYLLSYYWNTITKRQAKVPCKCNSLSVTQFSHCSTHLVLLLTLIRVEHINTCYIYLGTLQTTGFKKSLLACAFKRFEEAMRLLLSTASSGDVKFRHAYVWYDLPSYHKLWTIFLLSWLLFTLIRMATLLFMWLHIIMRWRSPKSSLQREQISMHLIWL